MWILYTVAITLIAVGSAQRKEYIPPNKGYIYETPPIPFPPNNGNTKPNIYLPPVTTLPTIISSGPTYIPPAQGPTTVHHNPHDHSHGDHDHGDHGHGDHGHGDHGHGDHHHHEPGMPFDFSYSVDEGGNDYRHNAVSDGDITRGEYRVALPDGRTQIVKYTADWKNGFNAEVTYEGEAHYPDQPGYGGGAPIGGPAYIPPSPGGGYRY